MYSVAEKMVLPRQRTAAQAEAQAASEEGFAAVRGSFSGCDMSVSYCGRVIAIRYHTHLLEDILERDTGGICLNIARPSDLVQQEVLPEGRVRTQERTRQASNRSAPV